MKFVLAVHGTAVMSNLAPRLAWSCGGEATQFIWQCRPT